MIGIPLDTIWPQLDLPSRLPVLSQIRDILTTLRSIRIPVPCAPSNYAFGGLTFSVSGSITTTVHPNGIGGPFQSAEGQWLSMLDNQLRAADKNVFIKGWKGADQPDQAKLLRQNTLRRRLDSFIEEDSGFRAILRQVAQEPIFVHGDLSAWIVSAPLLSDFLTISQSAKISSSPPTHTASPVCLILSLPALVLLQRNYWTASETSASTLVFSRHQRASIFICSKARNGRVKHQNQLVLVARQQVHGETLFILHHGMKKRLNCQRFLRNFARTPFPLLI